MRTGFERVEARLAMRAGFVTPDLASQLLEAALSDYLAGHIAPSAAELEARLERLLRVEGPVMVTPPWTLAPAALESMRGDLRTVEHVAGASLELTWGAEVCHQSQTIHSPRLAFIGASKETRFPGEALRDGGVVIHQHPGRVAAEPSDRDCEAALRLGLPSCGFAVANYDLTRLVIMKAPQPVTPPRSRAWCRSFGWGRFYGLIGWSGK